ncbi:hypothetical protein BJF78_27800 [Pseudonocardia sp. CNS-139]|nr:hypothetical protein BJF78_27800 [Pseudonocardia sp. CNS-139]
MTWFKSSYSAANDNCVECRVAPERVHVRDSKHRDGPSLVFPSDEWRVFVNATKAGEFDLA